MWARPPGDVELVAVAEHRGTLKVTKFPDVSVGGGLPAASGRAATERGPHSGCVRGGALGSDDSEVRELRSLTLYPGLSRLSMPSRCCNRRVMAHAKRPNPVRCHTNGRERGADWLSPIHSDLAVRGYERLQGLDAPGRGGHP